MLNPVMRRNRITIALGLRKQDTMHTTKNTPVMDLSLDSSVCQSYRFVLFVLVFFRTFILLGSVIRIIILLLVLFMLLDGSLNFRKFLYGVIVYL